MATRPSLPGGARRVAARLPGAVKVAAIAAGAATVAAGLLLGVLSSSPGHRLLLRLLTRAVQAEVDGQVRIRSLAGPLWRGADVRGVELATPDGRPVFRVERVRVRYGAWDLLRRRFVLSRVEIEGLVLALERGEGERGGGPATAAGTSSASSSWTGRAPRAPGRAR